MKLLTAAFLLNLLAFSTCEETRARKLGRSKNYFIRYIKVLHEKLYGRFDSCPTLADQLLPDTEGLVFRNHIQTLLRMKQENTSCSVPEIEPETVSNVMIKNNFNTKQVIYDKKLEKCNITVVVVDPPECDSGDLCNHPDAKVVFDPDNVYM